MARFDVGGGARIAGRARRGRGTCLASVLLAGLTAVSRPASAQPVEPIRPTRSYDLGECLSLAEKNYPKVREARAERKRLDARVWQAQTEPFSQFTSEAGLALVPTLRGTGVYSSSTDVALTGRMALGWQFGIDGVIPLWTFGKITNIVGAAEAHAKVGEFAIAKEQNDVKLSVRRAYYGMQLARDAAVLLRKAMRRIDKYVGRLQQRVDDDEADEIDLLKLKMHRAELDARMSEAAREAGNARAALQFLTGVEGDFDIPDVPLRRLPHHVAPLARYLSAARLFRPEINMARAGVLAREAQVRFSQSQYYPDLGLGLTARYSEAPDIDDQLNPFVRDPANFWRYGAALALRWKWDFLPASARIAQAQAELEGMRAKERFALGGVGVEVENAFNEAEAAFVRLDAYQRAVGYARRWLVIVQQGIDVGTFEDEDVVEPAKEFALKRFSEMNAIFDYNIALAKLAQATGWQAVAPAE